MDHKDKKVALFLADGFEEVEALTVVDILRRAGITCQMVSIKNNDTSVISSHNVRITADVSIGSICFDDYDMLVLPGGMPGTKNLASCSTLTDGLRSFYANGKEIAAICAAPTILAGLGFLRGVRATCYPGMESQMDGAILTHEAAVVSGNIITGRGVGCAIPFALKIVEHYLGASEADKISAGIVYK
jgi:4-methyl-5(b-hydroxyethyl)-thiazole monophosphate biosynthesis